MNAHTVISRMTECGIPLAQEAAEKLAAYHALLMKWNTRMDLTAVMDEEEMLDRHYADALSPLAVPGLLPAKGSLVDVGTGAGLPGVPLAIALPDWTIALLDAQQKRLRFLETVKVELALENMRILHSRAEDAGKKPALRESFDIAAARAVAALPVLLEYLLPLVRVGGRALCWKGPAVRAELPAGDRAARLLGGRLGTPIPAVFPGRSWEHLLLPADKTEATPRAYPRKAGMPARAPLG